MKLDGLVTPAELRLMLNEALDRIEALGATHLRHCYLYGTPSEARGERVTLRENGRIVSEIAIEPPYRQRHRRARGAEGYYATLAHEAAHWTKHPSRLNRELGCKRWGDEGYAREDLVAELAAACLCADLEITPEVREDHASYIDHWLRMVRDDNRAIFSAAAHAQRASDYLHGLQPVESAAAA